MNIAIALSMLALFLLLRDTQASVSQTGDTLVTLNTGTVSTLDSLYQKIADETGLDWLLLKAVAVVESSENPNAIGPSGEIGLMQILCNGDGPVCTNRLYIPDWPPERQALFDPETNIRYGAAILRWNIDTYGRDKGIAVYNRWASRNDPDGGPFVNQTYVNNVLSNYGGSNGITS